MLIVTLGFSRQLIFQNLRLRRHSHFRWKVRGLENLFFFRVKFMANNYRTRCEIVFPTTYILYNFFVTTVWYQEINCPMECILKAPKSPKRHVRGRRNPNWSCILIFVYIFFSSLKYGSLCQKYFPEFSKLFSQYKFCNQSENVDFKANYSCYHVPWNLFFLQNAFEQVIKNRLLDIPICTVPFEYISQKP